MSEPQIPRYPALSATDVLPDWIARVKARDPKNSIRRGFGCTIEAQSIIDPTVWKPIMLQHNGTLFATPEDRDLILVQIC